MQFSTILVTLTCALTALASPTMIEKRQCDTSGCKSECEAAGYVWKGNDDCWGNARVCDCWLP